MTERISAADFNDIQSKPKGNKRVKNTRKTTVGEIHFDSHREAKRFVELRHLERAGEIRDLRLQVPFDLLGKNGPILTPTGRIMTYRADFVFWDVKQARERILDAKGHPTDVSLMKIAIMAAQGFRVELV